VASAAERMVVIEKGRVAWSGTSDQLCIDTALQQRYLGV
jgi:ABC-type branched-subunit amino acid transport system ATPase component